MTTPDRGRAIVHAALWMAGMLFAISLTAVAARELAKVFSPFQIQAFRHAISLVVLFPFLAAQRFVPLRTRRFRLHLGRNVVHFGATVAWYLGVTLLPLAHVFAIEFTAPVWAAVLAVLFLGERLSPARIIAIVAGVIGTAVILRPGIAEIGPGVLAVLAAAVGFAVSFAATKSLTGTDRVITVLFYMSAIQLPMGLVPALFDWTPVTWPMLPWLLTVGVMGLLTHYCFTQALALADVTVVTPIDHLRLPLIAAVGLVVYGEALDAWVLGGGIIMFLGNYYNVRTERRLARGGAER